MTLLVTTVTIVSMTFVALKMKIIKQTEGYVPKYGIFDFIWVLYINKPATEILVRRKNWSGDQNFQNISPGGPLFSENFGSPVKIMVRPAPQANSACCCLVCLIELDYYTMADSCN